MKQPLPLLALACALAACSDRAPDDRPAAEAKALPSADTAKPAPLRDTRLTVYSGDYDALAGNQTPQPGMPGYALVERPLRYPLKRGDNAIAAHDMPPSMDIEATTLNATSPGVGILGQRYIAALSGTRDALTQAVGRKVTVEHTAGGAKQTDTGTLLASNDGQVLTLADGRIEVIRDYDSLSLIEGSDLLPKSATLQWTVHADRDGEADFTLAYPMGGMAWRAEYLATLAAGDDCRLALDGAALIANRSGVGFDAARVSLVAGEPNRVSSGPSYDRMEFAMAPPAPAAATAASLPSERTAGEYHAYDLPEPVRLVHGSTERVPLFAPRSGIACERKYVVDAGNSAWQPPRPQLDPGFRDRTGDLPVVVAVSVKNEQASGLGRPLPAGRVRVFDGTDFLGESRLPHTPAGADIRLEVGKSFDLQAQREATGFRLDRSGRTLTESFSLTLSNGGKRDATLDVIEPLPRWSQWEIVASSLPARRKDAQHIEFEVPVAAGGKTVLTYTVRYNWPKDTSP